MFLSKHANGTYYIIYNQTNGKRTSVSTRTKSKAEAYKFLCNFNTELKKKQEAKATPITLKQFLWEYLKHSESYHRRNTTKSIKSTANALSAYFGNIQLAELTKARLSEYLDYRIRTVSPYVGRRDQAYLSGMLNWALEQEFLEANPAVGIKRAKVPEKAPLFFSKTDFNVLLDSTESDDLKDIFVFALNTGMRQGEIINLQWGQIDLINLNIHVNNSTHLSKSGKIRTVPINKAVHKILVKRLKLEQNWVFTYQGQKISQQFISHKTKKIIKKTKLNHKLNFHSLRHSCASLLVQAGVDLYRVAGILGHSDLRVTKIYAHLRQDDLRNALSCLDN